LTFTYVLRSEVDSEWYTGSTGDLRARLRLHAEGRVRLTASRLAEYLTGLRDNKLERHEV